jgi:hypothetical protein
MAEVTARTRHNAAASSTREVMDREARRDDRQFKRDRELWTCKHDEISEHVVKIKSEIKHLRHQEILEYGSIKIIYLRVGQLTLCSRPADAELFAFLDPTDP